MAKTGGKSGRSSGATKGKGRSIAVPEDAPQDREVAHALREISTLLELMGESPFKVRAYAAAASSVEQIAGELAARVSAGTLMEVKGIGESIAAKITELVTTGRLSYRDELAERVPSGVRDLLHIPGLGPKRAMALHEELRIASVGELEYACRENRLVDLPGFGSKSQENILNGIAFLKKFADRYLIDVALAEAQKILPALASVKGVCEAAIAGSLRRRKELIGDLDFLVSAGDAEAIEAFTVLPEVHRVTAKGGTKASVVLESGMQADLRVVGSSQFPCALHYFTGSKAHNIAMRQRAQKRNWKLNEYALASGGRPMRVKDEAQLFRKLDLDYIPPELRENTGEIEAAERGGLPALIEEEDIKGALHVHTIASDGSSTIEQLALAAQERGWQYLGISDHSKSAAYAGGLDVAAVRKQKAEVEALQKRGIVHIFFGIESDIREDGALDYPDDLLALFDFVVASVHSRFNMGRERMTRRVVRAIEQPSTTILGHPTGRLLLARDEYEIDIDAVLAACAKSAVAVELNSHPQRLDLDWRRLRRAKELGLLVAVNPDAHSVEGLDDMRYGVAIARKGWLEERDVLNARSVKEIEKIFLRRKGASP